MPLIQELCTKWRRMTLAQLDTGFIDTRGVCNAAGDILRSLAGYDDTALRDCLPAAGISDIASILTIPRGQAALLASPNTAIAPEDVLEAPEAVLGPHAARLLALWTRLDRLPPTRWAQIVTEPLLTFAIGRAVAEDASLSESGILANRAVAEAAAAVVACTAWDHTRHPETKMAPPLDTDAVHQAFLYASYEVMGAPRLKRFLFLSLFRIMDPVELGPGRPSRRRSR